MNVVAFLDRHGRERPGHPALVGETLRVTYAELSERVAVAAARLAPLGIEPGDPVLFTAGSFRTTVVGMLAIAHVGGVIVAREGGDAPLDSLPEALGRPYRGLLGPAGAAPDPGFAHLPRMDLEELTAPWTGPGSPPDPGADPSPADRLREPLVSTSTSGTTGQPRTFLQTHDHILWRCRQATRLLGIGPSTRFLQLPLLNTSLGRRQMINLIVHGATLVWTGAKIGAELLDFMQRERISYTLVTPSHLERWVELAGDPASPLLPDLTLAVTSAPLGQDLFLRARAKLTPRVIDVYGTNESGILAFAWPEDRLESPGTVGRPDPEIELELVDDAGRPVADGDIGHVRTRSDALPAGYLDDGDRSGRHFEDGWFYPGDMASRDGAGRLHLAGRRDDVINNQGVKFYPAEVERVLRQHPSIADAAVTPWPHPEFNQVGVALVVLRGKTTERDVRVFCSERLPAYQVPRRVLVATQLPRSPTGKVPRAELKAQVERLLALHPERRKRVSK